MSRSLAALTVALVATAALAGPGKKEAERAINELRTAKDAKSKAAALMEIGKIGQVQKVLVASATDDVVKSLKDKEPTVRAAAAECYGMLDPEPKEAVPVLVKLMTDDDDLRVKTGAVNGLAALGSGAKEAVKDLDKLRKEFGQKARDIKPTAPQAEQQQRRQYNALAQAAGAAVNRINGKR